MNIDKLGTYIFERRKQLNMTQQQLADLVGVTNKAVSKWERGQSIPDITLFKSIAQHLDVEVIDLLSAGDLQDNEQIGKKEVATLMEKTLETLQSFNIHKIIKAVYVSAIILLSIGLFTTLLIDFVLNHTATWSLITSSSILGAMILFTIVRLTYKNIKYLVFGLMTGGLLISVPILYTIGIYYNDTYFMVNTLFPFIISALVSVVIAFIYFNISKANTWIKVHVSFIIIDFINVLHQVIVMDNMFVLIPNIVGLIVLLITLPVTINYIRKK